MRSVLYMVLIGSRIKELRNQYKYTQTELAEKVGVTKSTIAAYENNSRQPSYEVLIKMADVFNVSTDSLLLDRKESKIDISGLNPSQISILESLVSYFRKSELLEAFYGNDQIDVEGLMKKYPDIVNKYYNENDK